MGTICNQTDRREFNTYQTLAHMLIRVDDLFVNEADHPSPDARLAAAIELYKAEYQIDNYDRQDENICGIHEALMAMADALKDVASTIDRLGDKVGDLEDNGVAKALQNLAFVVDNKKFYAPLPGNDWDQT